jgi:hypothetical protein
MLVNTENTYLVIDHCLLLFHHNRRLVNRAVNLLKTAG